ncbi:insulin-like growth factor 2 [Arctopsyche grandis]|uniref:insulin-like growth factor 2 n=1 Tax=Arctopsyche grandis TaxID=121162 RepID=UPI00406D9D32
MFIQQQIFLILGLNALIVSCLPYGSGKYKFCGAHLMDALQLICGHTGYQPPFWDVSTTERLTLIKYQELNSAGIATECCHKGCTWTALGTYCADPHRRIRESALEGMDFSSFGLGEPVAMADQGVVASKLMAVAPEVDIESIKRSAPVFGTVSPEYLRLPRTLDDVPEIYRGIQSGF